MWIYVVTQQIVLLDTYCTTNLVKWVCLHCTIALFHAHRTFLGYNLILKVVFLFQSFLVNAVYKFHSKLKLLSDTFFVYFRNATKIICLCIILSEDRTATEFLLEGLVIFLTFYFIRGKFIPKQTFGPFLTLSVRNGPSLQSYLFKEYIFFLNPSPVE